MRFEKLTLPFWMAGTNAQSILRSCERWWQLVAQWVQLPIAIDPETAPLKMVDLLAWERNVQRIKDEPEQWYRMRVKFALANAKDAGTANGLKRIFERMGMPSVLIRERLPQYDWDQVELNVRASDLHGKRHMFDLLVRKFFRTCRRFIYALEAEPYRIAFGAVAMAGEVVTVYPIIVTELEQTIIQGKAAPHAIAETTTIYPQ